MQHDPDLVSKVGTAKGDSPLAPFARTHSGQGALELEWLESRLAPATHTWTGAASNLWSANANWNGGSPAEDPSAALVFPGGAANLSNMNDLTNLSIQSITFSGTGYTMSGNGLVQNGGGITLDSMVTTSVTTVNLPITLGATQTWTLTNASATMQVGSVIGGAANAALTKAGAGILILTGANTYTGTTTVAAGTLLVNGAQPGSNVIVAAATTLGGSGTVGTITASGAITPGGPGTGILHSGNVIFTAGSSLVIMLSGAAPGSGYSQLNVTGTVNLSGKPTLTVTIGNFLPAVGRTFTPVTSTGGVTGTFNGLAENSILTVASRNFRVNYQANAVLLTLTSINTQTAVTSSVNPSVFGQPIALTATVSATLRFLPTPTGTVTFREGENTLGSASVNTNGVATFSPTTPFAVGTHTITAAYSGDSQFATSTSSLTQTINRAATTTTVTSSANPSAFGQPVTFTATVSAVAPATGTPTGMVTFRDGTGTLGTATLAANGTATFTFLLPDVPLAPGTHSITAVYNGDNNFMPSTSPTLAQAVNQARTTTAITSSPNPSPFGRPVTLTATVSIVSGGGFILPTGTVTFKDGTTTLGTATLVAGGQATFVTSSLSVGSHAISAVYSGDSTYAGSTSLALVQTISQPAGTPNQNYVTQLYRDVLRRAPDTGGLRFWTGLLDQNQASRSQVALGFVNSQEFRMQEVEDAYRRFLHRAADPTGLSGWT